MIHKLYNPLELSSIMEETKFLWEDEDLVIFPKERAESVIKTFDLIIKFIEIPPKKNSITIKELKAIKRYCEKLYYNEKVILQ